MLKLSTDRRLQLKQVFAYLGDGSDASCCGFVGLPSVNTLRTGLLNCLNALSRGLTFRHRAFCI